MVMSPRTGAKDCNKRQLPSRERERKDRDIVAHRPIFFTNIEDFMARSGTTPGRIPRRSTMVKQQ